MFLGLCPWGGAPCPEGSRKQDPSGKGSRRTPSPPSTRLPGLGAAKALQLADNPVFSATLDLHFLFMVLELI